MGAFHTSLKTMKNLPVMVVHVVEVVAVTPANVSLAITVPGTVVGNAGLLMVVAIVSVLATIVLLTVMFAVAVAQFAVDVVLP